MIKDCHSFERRVQQLMDSRIDPETDEALWRHGAQCPDCYQSLMACSLLHSEFLNDSDSMKIKLDTIGLHDLQIRRTPNSRVGYFVSVIVSLAALVVLSLWLLPNESLEHQTQPVAMNRQVFVTQDAVYSAEEAVASFTQLRDTLDPYEITTVTSQWSPIKPIQTLSQCLEWIQRSLNSTTETIQGSEIPDPQNLRSEFLHTDAMLLALI